MMRYAMFDLDVARPLRDLPLASTDAGLAVLVRRHDVPIGFLIRENDGSTSLSAAALETLISAELGTRLLAEALRQEIAATIPTPEAPSLTIAICTKDRPEGVQRLLESLAAPLSAAPAGSAKPEILLVDNAPTDDRTRDLAARFPGVRYVREARPGLNFGRNRALHEAGGDFLAFLDDDVVADRGWFVGLCEAWSANRDAAAFTGQVLPMELETQAQVVFERRGGFRRGFERLRFGAVSPGDRLYPGGAGNFGAGANMAFRRSVLLALGGFDEALDTGATVPGGGDLDIFYRVIRGGHTLVYEPRFLVFHQHRREMAALERQYRRSWGLGFMCYLAKCIETDPERRVNLLRLIAWWFVHHTRDLLGHVKKRMRGQYHIPPRLLIGELWGGVLGLTGGYGRSRRRVERIRRQFP